MTDPIDSITDIGRTGGRLPSRQKFWIVLGLLWLAGVGLRLTILVVPPVILLIAADLHLSGTRSAFFPDCRSSCSVAPRCRERS